MEKANEVTLVFDSRPVNEALARITAASFCTQLNPTLEEVADLKTAVSEAVTNSIIHAYEGEIHKIEMKLCITGQEIYVGDHRSWEGNPGHSEGNGTDVHHKGRHRPVRYGIYLYGGIYG